jgi:hypothetical protein
MSLHTHILLGIALGLACAVAFVQWRDHRAALEADLDVARVCLAGADATNVCHYAHDKMRALRCVYARGDIDALADIHRRLSLDELPCDGMPFWVWELEAAEWAALERDVAALAQIPERVRRRLCVHRERYAPDVQALLTGCLVLVPSV